MATTNKEILLYTKKVQIDKKKSFTKFLARYRNVTYDCNLSNDCKDKLESEMSASKLTYPIKVSVDINSDDYFIKVEKYTRNDGSKGEKYVIVIQDYQGLAQGEFDNKRTLDDLK